MPRGYTFEKPSDEYLIETFNKGGSNLICKETGASRKVVTLWLKPLRHIIGYPNSWEFREDRKPDRSINIDNLVNKFCFGGAL
jgi:hypothetical protein